MQLELFEPAPEKEPARAANVAHTEVSPTPDWHAQEMLRASLERYSGLRVELVVTENSSTMMSVKHVKRGSVARLRVHRMFVTAPDAVVRALGSWVTLRKNESAAAVLNEYIRTHRSLIREKRPRREPVKTEGRHFDLDALYREVNRDCFCDEVTAKITWGRYPPNERRRSITFGSYSQREHLIRISPLLDRDFVPKYFVRFIVFHEMLHAHLGIDERPGARRCIHGKDFRRAEKAHPDYQRAVAWQEANLKRFLQSRRFFGF